MIQTNLPIPLPWRAARLLDGYKSMTEHDWPERRLYEALALRDECDAAAGGPKPFDDEPTRLRH